VLFIRPAEILPALEALPIYELLMVGCIIASFTAILQQFEPRSLAHHPMTFCVVVMLVSVLFSHLFNGNLFLAREYALDFLKVVLFYLMLVGLVNSVHRLRLFLQVTAFYIFVIASLSLLHHYDFIQLEALEAMAQLGGLDEETGERTATIRLQASGIFNDPNDFSLILCVGILVVTHMLLESKRKLVKLACLLPLGVFMFALALTRSRGGLLAMVAGVMMTLVSRMGWKKGMAIGFLCLPPMLVAFGGRQTNFNFDEGDTGHGRVEIWRDAIQMFKGAPLFGAGRGEMAEQLYIAAHNSFVHSYAELGLLGGTAFLALFFIPVYCLRLHGAATTETLEGESPETAEVRRWRPCVFAIICSYGMGLCSLSRAYVVVTYLVLGIAAVYLSLAVTHRTIAPPAVGALFKKVMVASVGFLFCLYVFVRVVT
jgi:O-antigen ligase